MNKFILFATFFLFVSCSKKVNVISDCVEVEVSKLYYDNNKSNYLDTLKQIETKFIEKKILIDNSVNSYKKLISELKSNNLNQMYKELNTEFNDFYLINSTSMMEITILKSCEKDKNINNWIYKRNLLNGGIDYKSLSKINLEKTSNTDRLIILNLIYLYLKNVNELN
jgi:hypothetical protein